MNEQGLCGNRGRQAVKSEVGRTHLITFRAAHEPLCQHALADGQQQGEEPNWEATAGVGQVTRGFWRREMCIINSPGLADLLYLFQHPKGRELKHNSFDNLYYFIILFFKLSSLSQDITESVVTAGF